MAASDSMMKQILVVDEHVGRRTALIEHLRGFGRGWSAAEAADKVEALASATANPVDLVIVALSGDRNVRGTLLDFRFQYPWVKAIGILDDPLPAGHEIDEYARTIGAHAVLHRPRDLHVVRDLARTLLGLPADAPDE